MNKPKSIMFTQTNIRLRRWALLFMMCITCTHTFAQSNRDVLLEIANKCLDVSAPNYCSACATPRLDAACKLELQCRSSLEVWSQNNEFTSFRDVKMCGCNEDFVHGLTIPIKPITGVEDPLRPNSIWNFAWKVGSTKIPESELALVVNPKNKRSQDQLHVHMLRFYPERMIDMNLYFAEAVADLDLTWRSAQRYADSKGWNDYGVLITKSAPSSFSIFVTPFNSEHAFTHYKCN
jgi:CDP-diacylglycerol pyrophosphatase